MSRRQLERRMTDISGRLKRLRADVAVSHEQMEHFDTEADDARLRALVSETPLADAEAREAQRHADAQRSAHASLLRSIGDLEREQDALLDRRATELAP